MLYLLFFCNAHAVKLTECYISDRIYDGKTDDENIASSFQSEKYDTNSYEIDLRNALIKRQIIYNDKYYKEENAKILNEIEKSEDDQITKESKKSTYLLTKILTKNYNIDYADDRIISSKNITKNSVQGNAGVVSMENERNIKIDLKNYTVITTFIYTISNNDLPVSISKTITTFNCKKSKSSGGQGIASSGSGFFVNNKGYFITNNHVVDGCTQSKITFKEETIDAELIATDQSLDLALLRVKVKPKDFLNLSKDPPEKLQKIYVAGYPFGKGLSDDLKFTQGIISSVKGFADNSNQIQIDAAINSGNSGGPIVDEDGSLIAVAVSGLDKSQSEGIGFGIKANSVINFLEVNNVKYSTPGILNFGMSSNKLNKLLEKSTVYTFCN